MIDQSNEQIFKDIVDYLAPIQTPTEQAIYYYLIRWSLFENKETIQIGHRKLASVVSASAKGKLAKQPGLSPGTASITLNDLVDKKHLILVNTEHKGKIFKVCIPSEIQECSNRMKRSKKGRENEINYFRDPEKRKELFDRDSWKCYLCGKKVTEEDAVLDHYIPQCKGGTDNKENLKTACCSCNSIKSGKSYEEAAPLILQKIVNRQT